MILKCFFWELFSLTRNLINSEKFAHEILKILTLKKLSEENKEFSFTKLIQSRANQIEKRVMFHELFSKNFKATELTLDLPEELIRTIGHSLYNYSIKNSDIFRILKSIFQRIPIQHFVELKEEFLQFFLETSDISEKEKILIPFVGSGKSLVEILSFLNRSFGSIQNQIEAWEQNSTLASIAELVFFLTNVKYEIKLTEPLKEARKTESKFDCFYH